MNATENPVAELEQLFYNDRDLTCEVSWECEHHGRCQCESRARWVATLDIAPSQTGQMLACDDCHDDLVEHPEGHEHPIIGWREL